MQKGMLDQGLVRVWQHLSNAGLVEGQFGGAPSSSPNASPFGLEVGLNMPDSAIDQSGYTLHFARHVMPGEVSGVYGAKYGHIIVFGRIEPPFACPSEEPCFLPGPAPLPAMWPAVSGEAAMTIDKKIDDGLPGTGAVMSFTPDASATPSCTTSSSETEAAYRSDGEAVTCSLIFTTGL